MAHIVLKDFTKHFDQQVHAVESLNLEIHDREFVVLLGASGSGKSTTLNLIAGIEEPTQGDIFMDGDRITDYPPNEREMAMVFQNYALYPQMTVLENIVFSLKLQKVPLDERMKRAKSTAEMLGIEGLLDRKPSQLSGGQQQRVALGRAIIRNPKVFLLDEPLSNLDAKLRLKMRSDLRRLHLDIGVTTIYVTHDQVEAMTMADKIALLYDGKLVAYDSPKNLYNRPPNLYTADFLGSPPINLISGSLDVDEHGGVFTFDNYHFRIHREILSNASLSTPKKVVFGIRPEDVLVRQSDDSGVGIGTSVDLVEFIGADSYLYNRLCHDCEIISRAEAGSSLKIGDPIRIDFRQEKIHLFEAESGERII